MAVINDDRIRFSTGKHVYAHNGIIGLGPDLHVYEGYDGGIDTAGLTAEERRELADYMIGLWTQFRTAARTEKEG